MIERLRTSLKIGLNFLTKVKERLKSVKKVKANENHQVKGYIPIIVNATI
jgi:hypothetical protein